MSNNPRQFVSPLLLSLVYLTLAVIAFAGEVGAEASPDSLESSHESSVINNEGKAIGSLKLTQGTSGVLINLELQGLAPGYHGMHFHTHGDCSDLKKFKSAGGHVDPHKKPHGYLNAKGPHEGNLPNLVVSKDGSARVELYSEMVSLRSGEAALLDADGSALIVHTNKDDHMSQPIGGSGARVACAVIKKAEKKEK